MFPPFRVRAASGSLREVVKLPTLSHSLLGLFNGGRSVVLSPVSLRRRATELQTCGISTGVSINLLPLNFCIADSICPLVNRAHPCFDKPPLESPRGFSGG